MSDIFDEDEEDLLEEADDFVVVDDDSAIDIDEISEGTTLDARRRLENMLEEKRLRAELDDGFDDY